MVPRHFVCKGLRYHFVPWPRQAIDELVPREAQAAWGPRGRRDGGRHKTTRR